MQNRVRVFVTAAVLLAAGFRIWAIADPAVKPLNELQSVRDAILADWNAAEWSDATYRVVITRPLAEAGVTGITFERFDSTAWVVIRAGPDRQPGAAGVDDNADGVVDNQSELGATGSDDVCLVQSADDSLQDTDEPLLLLQKGAFVPATATELRDHPGQYRAVVTGRTGNDNWSILVTLPPTSHRN